MIDNASGLQFVEVAAGLGDLRFANYDLGKDPNKSTAAGYATYPVVQLTEQGGYIAERSGDVFLDDSTIDYSDSAKTHVILHEIGHALGLKHPFEGDIRLSPELDNNTYSVMSYTGYEPKLGSVDLEALRVLYGAPSTDGRHVASWSWNAATATMTQTGTGAADTIRGGRAIDVIRGMGGDDIIVSGDGKDRLDGGEGADTLFGLNGDDTLDGGNGNDTLDGGNGNDTLNGGDGNDTINGWAGLNRASGGAGDDTINGGDGNDAFDGGADNDVLNGWDGNDTLVGGAGLDTLYGGNGNDRLEGGDGNDALSTGDGTDTALGGAGDDALYGGLGVDTLVGEAGDDTASGWDGDDVLTGGIGLDRLWGGNGADRINGGGDNDVLNGDDGNDRLVGEAGKDDLWGGAGNDRLIGGAGEDWLSGGAGSDTIDYSAATASVVVDLAVMRTAVVNGTTVWFNAQGADIGYDRIVEAETVIGGSAADTLTGDEAANVLDGRGGADQLRGGGGGDTYVVDNGQDGVVEAAGGGRDTVLAATSYALAAGQEIEGLQLLAATGATPLALTGNGFGQTLVGNNGANVLDGQGGADLLLGRGGADSFAFSTALGASNLDHIADFAAEDTVRLSKSVFSVLALGQLSERAFKNLATGAADADDRIVYNQKTGDLWYDVDGSGRAAGVKFAVLDNKVAITHADVFAV